MNFRLIFMGKGLQSGYVVGMLVGDKNCIDRVGRHADFRECSAERFCALACINENIGAARTNIGTVTARARVEIAYFVIVIHITLHLLQGMKKRP